MGYELDAVIGSPAAVRTAVAPWPAATIVPLGSDLALVPLTGDLSGSIAVGESPVHGFRTLLPRLAESLATASHTAPVAYVEAEYFGGVGTQHAALWSGGRLTLGPLTLGENEPRPEAGTPLSRILAALGVPRTGHQDEFDTAGLDRHRHTEDWLA